MLNNSFSLERLFYALSDPSRLAIVEQLSQSEASVSDLARPLNMTLAGVVQHIQVLEENQVIRTSKVGRSRICRLEPKAFRTLEKWISQRRNFMENDLDRMGHYLEELEKGRQ